MKIDVVTVTEHEDGSATIELSLDCEALTRLAAVGARYILTRAAEKEDGGDEAGRA